MVPVDETPEDEVGPERRVVAVGLQLRGDSFDGPRPAASAGKDGRIASSASQSSASGKSSARTRIEAPVAPRSRVPPTSSIACARASADLESVPSSSIRPVRKPRPGLDSRSSPASTNSSRATTPVPGRRSVKSRIPLGRIDPFPGCVVGQFRGAVGDFERDRAGTGLGAASGAIDRPGVGPRPAGGPSPIGRASGGTSRRSGSPRPDRSMRPVGCPRPGRRGRPGARPARLASRRSGQKAPGRLPARRGPPAPSARPLRAGSSTVPTRPGVGPSSAKFRAITSAIARSIRSGSTRPGRLRPGARIDRPSEPLPGRSRPRLPAFLARPEGPRAWNVDRR